MVLAWVFSGLLLGATVTTAPASHEVCEAWAVIWHDRGVTGECSKIDTAPAGAPIAKVEEKIASKSEPAPAKKMAGKRKSTVRHSYPCFHWWGMHIRYCCGYSRPWTY